MRRPKFCSQCGEKITRGYNNLWARPGYCRTCAPRFGRLPLIIMLACSLSGSYLLGRLSAPRDPFYLIGAPIDPRTGESLVPGSKGTSPAANAATAAPSAERAESSCGARTKSGRACRRKVRGGGYCWQHRESGDKKSGDKKTAAK